MHRFAQWSKRTTVIAASVLFIVGVFGLIMSYRLSLEPVNPRSNDEVRVVVAQGDSLETIAGKLKQADLIRNTYSFRIYTELTGTKNRLQAGGYALTKNQSVPEIIDHLSTGRTDEFSVTILPGLTLKQLLDSEVKGSLVQQGFSKSELESAFKAVYDHPLLSSKPATDSLEGYVYPDTYRVVADTSAKDLLIRSFDEFYGVIQEEKIIEGLGAKGLNLHQGITLASIIQKEVKEPLDQTKVAQVFLKRLAEGMMLGSDPTFIYAAEREGKEPTINFDSPYNTRVHPGLPPGPIANFNMSALRAVVSPAAGDFLFFVADRQGITYFARTLEEHEANVSKYCPECKSDYRY